MRYSIPLPGDEDITVEGPFPVSERDWGQFMAVLEAMKPGLVAAPEGQDPEDSLDDNLMDAGVVKLPPMEGDDDG